MSRKDGGIPVHCESDHRFTQTFRNLGNDLGIVVVRNLVDDQQAE